MPWTFDSIVSEGREPDRGDTAIHSLRGRFLNGNDVLIRETFWYFTPASTYVAPTNQQKAARRDEILAQLNDSGPEFNLIDEYLDELRIAYRRARNAGHTRNEILTGLRDYFKSLWE